MVETDLKFQESDYVVWTLDGDIGIITHVARGSDEPYFIEWFIDPGASGWHEEVNILELLGGDQ